MPTQKKIEQVEEYREKFKSCKSIFLADYSGINVAETTKLRRSFRAANVEYCILKNTLAKRSLKDAGIEGMDEMLVGMTAFAFSDEDAVAPIRVIKEFNKQVVYLRVMYLVRRRRMRSLIYQVDQIFYLNLLACFKPR